MAELGNHMVFQYPNNSSNSDKIYLFGGKKSVSELSISDFDLSATIKP